MDFLFFFVTIQLIFSHFSALLLISFLMLDTQVIGATGALDPGTEAVLALALPRAPALDHALALVLALLAIAREVAVSLEAIVRETARGVAATDPGQTLATALALPPQPIAPPLALARAHPTARVLLVPPSARGRLMIALKCRQIRSPTIRTKATTQMKNWTRKKPPRSGIC